VPVTSVNQFSDAELADVIRSDPRRSDNTPAGRRLLQSGMPAEGICDRVHSLTSASSAS